MNDPIRRPAPAVTHRGVAVRVVLAVTACVLVLAGCQITKSSATGTAGAPTSTPTGAPETTTTPTPTPSPAAPPPPPAAKARVTVKIGSMYASEGKHVAIGEPVQVTAIHGVLGDVTVQSNGGSTVDGALAADRATWKSVDGTVMASGRTYTVSATATNRAGVTTTKTASFTTKQSAVLGSDITPTAGTTVGVGMPIIVRFTAPVRDKATVEKNMVVTSTKPVVGGWHWFSSTEVHYRPQTYWPSKTDVTLRTNLRGVQAGPNLTGIRNKVKTFHVGTSQISKVSLTKQTLDYYVDGKLDRRIPVSAGKPGWETRSGTKLIINKRTNINMRSSTIGVAKGDKKEFFDLWIKYALRITFSGEYLHSAPWSVDKQGKVNSSHGCVGMSPANAKYLWDRSIAGDPVETVGSKKRMPVIGNGYGDWNLTFAQWQAGSAL